MKRIICFAFAFLFVFILLDNVYAYENNIYKIEIPGSFIKSYDTDFWKLDSKDSTTTISINISNNDKKINFENYKSRDLNKKKYIQEIEKHLKEQYGNIQIKSSNIILTKINKYKSIKIDVISNYVDSGKYNSTVYQSQYILSSKKYLYNITISSSDLNEFQSPIIKNIVDSFEIKDKILKKDKKFTKFYLSISILIALCLLFISLYKKRINKK